MSPILPQTALQLALPRSRSVRDRRRRISSSPPNHYPTTLATLPRHAQRHQPADATGTSRPRSPDHARSQPEQRRHPAISHRNRCARTVKTLGGPVPALLQNSEIDLFTHSPFASRPLTHSHGAPFGGALRARLLHLSTPTSLHRPTYYVDSVGARGRGQPGGTAQVVLSQAPD